MLTLPNDFAEVETQLRQRIAHIKAVEKIGRCIDTCKIIHAAQWREDDQPYAIHPMRLCLVLLQLEPDVSVDVLCGALLHDALEDTDYSADAIGRDYGAEVLRIVQGCTREHPNTGDEKVRHDDKRAHHAKVMQVDRAIRLVKCADHLDNLVSMRNIAPGAEAYGKMPRRIWQAEEYGLPLAAITGEAFVQAVQEQIDYYLAAGFSKGDWRGV